MIELSLLAIVVIATANLIVAIRTLRSSLKSEGRGENRYELLRDQQEWFELLREERRTLLEELERESQERGQLTAYLEQTDPRLKENLEQTRQARTQNEREVGRLEQEIRRVKEEFALERRKRLEVQERAEQLEHELEVQSQVRQDAERLGHEGQQMMEDLETEREQRLATQQQVESLEDERQLLQQEHRRVKGELDQMRRERKEFLRRAEGAEQEQTEVSGVQQEAERLR
jgi:chromosome segregation ATPase